MSATDIIVICRIRSCFEYSNRTPNFVLEKMTLIMYVYNINKKEQLRLYYIIIII